MTETVTHRRGAAVAAGVLDATLQLLTEQGYAFSVDDVATLAGVHKTTIYRRWETKPLLVAAAVQRLAEHEVVVRRTGDVVADLTLLAVQVARALRSPAGRNAIRATLAAAASQPELVDVAREFFLGRYGEAVSLIIEGQTSGVLRADAVPLLVWQAIVNPLHMNAICDLDTSDTQAEALVALALDGARSRRTEGAEHVS